MHLKLIRENKLVFLCFLIAAILLFKNLGNIYLWSDEANSAMVAKNILEFGYPANFDGRNIVQHYWYYGSKLKLSPFYRTTTWLHLYLAALSFWLLGINTFAARFPFALVGLSVIISLFLFLRKYEPDKFIINTAVLLLTFCIPFYLQMRQCRYYSLATLFILLGTWGYLDFYQHGRKAKFIICSLLLFLSMHSAYPVLMLAAAVHSLLFYRRERMKALFICWGWMLPVVVPVTLFLKLWERPLDLYWNFERQFNLNASILHFIRYLSFLNDYLIPVVLLLIYLIWSWRRKELTYDKFRKNQLVTFAIIVLFVAITFLSSVAPQRFRFIAPYIPLSLIPLSYMLRFFKEHTNRYAVIILILILISTNLIHQLPYTLKFVADNPQARKLLAKADNKRISWYFYKMGVFWNPTSFLYNYLYEITHDYDGPNEGISRYINQRAGKDDTVKTPYGDYACQFYTNRIVVPRGEFENEIMPDWWVFRDFWWYNRLFYKYKDILAKDYEKIVLDYPDIPWENLPEPDSHKFRTVKDAPRVVIYRRKKPRTPVEIARDREILKQMWPWK